MCGIVGYLGNKNAKEIIIKGLKRLKALALTILEKNRLEFFFRFFP